MLLSTDQLEADLELLASSAFFADPADIALCALDLLTPPELISTTECAAKYRLFPNAEGTGSSLWSPTLTPYINGIQDALDDPDVEMVVVPKPGRVGGTVAAENHLFKRLKFGPLTDTLWYLASDSEVDSYVDKIVAKMFELHPDIQAKVGKTRTEDKRKFKRISGRDLEYLPANEKTITNRQAGFIVVDELDSVKPKLRGTFADQAKIRGATIGTRRKAYLCSHMDAGWTAGIAPAWKESSRGIFYWPCPHCDGFSSPCPTAPKGWRTRLAYERAEGVSDDEMLDRVTATAGLECPHCGKKAADVHKPAMLARGVWVHEGQSIDRKGRVTGEPRSKKVMGFWIHGTMSPWVSWADLARRYVSALVFFERTKKSERLRQVTAKVLGEVYEGAGASNQVVDPAKLRARCEDAPEDEVFEAGTVPAGVMFLTAAVDPGGAKYDVQIEGWDLDGRNWKIERFTIRQRMVEGRMTDLRPGERQDDWIVLRDEVLRRVVPLAADPAMGMRVAGMAIDTGGVPGATPKAREFARRMQRDGESGRLGYRVRLIKGGTSKNAPEVGQAREINKDDEGRAIAPPVKEFTLNVDKLKGIVVERLLIEEDGAGFVRFADGLPMSIYDELAGEVLVDGTWERRGANEALDLSGYNEAVRIMLQPERADINWEKRPPVWARPVPIAEAEDEDPEPAPPVLIPPKPKLSAIDRLAALNRS